jgi:hypothetical protein
MGFPKKIAVVEPDGFREHFQSWFEACREKRTDYYASEYPSLVETTRYELETEERQRYIRIVATEYSVKTGEMITSSAWAFVDKTNGDVLKADSATTPAKGARGNIFDEHNGMRRIGVYGPAYNR